MVRTSQTRRHYKSPKSTLGVNMSRSPAVAREILDKSELTKHAGDNENIAVYNFNSGRELALLIENKMKESVYISRYPKNLPDIIHTTSYKPTAEKSGRHSNLNTYTRTLGFEYEPHLIEVKSPTALVKLITWYQYA